ncbi:ankyrin repeat domain-containing protein [Candidatus Dependentiae bacterium]|nr:ankyrin repeat domain-containing protein [Candidatus Dependentiae bacterium]
MVTTRMYTVLLIVMLLVALPTEVVPGNAMRTMRNTVRSLTGYPVDRDNNPLLQSFSLLDAVRDGDSAAVQAMTSGMSIVQIRALIRLALESGYPIDRDDRWSQSFSQEFIGAADAVVDGNLPIVQAMTFGMSEVQLASLLLIATEYRCLPSIRYLIERGAYGRIIAFECFISELNGAIRSRDMVIMQSLLIAASQAEKDIALRLALRMNYQPFVRYLLEHGADMYIVSQELREQIFADSIAQIDAVVHHNDDSVIDIALLLQAAKKTALSRAINNDDLAVVQYLVEQGETDIHSYDDWALRDAAHETRWAIARYLIQQGSNPANHLTEEQKESIARCGRKAAG